MQETQIQVSLALQDACGSHLPADHNNIVQVTFCLASRKRKFFYNKSDIFECIPKSDRPSPG